MKIKLLFLAAFVILLAGCAADVHANADMQVDVNSEVEHVYTVTKETDYFCAEALEIVYTDEEYVYYFPCLESSKFVVTNENGDSYSVYELLEQNLLSIEEVYELFDGSIKRIEASEFGYK